MPASDMFVTAGGGLAGAKAEEALRGQGFDGRIVLAAEEDIRPCERPPLSKEYLQGKADRETMFTTASRVLIIGAGWIGLEVAAAARLAGVHVTIVEMAELPLLQVLGPQVTPAFAGLHREHGVDLRLGVRLAGPAVPLNEVAA